MAKMVFGANSDKTSAAFKRLLLASFVVVPLIPITAHLIFPNTTAIQATTEMLLMLIAAGSFGAMQLNMIRHKEDEHATFIQNLTDNLNQAHRTLEAERLYYVELQHALNKLQHVQSELAAAQAQNRARDARILELRAKFDMLRQANQEIQQLAAIFMKHQQLNHKELYVVADDLAPTTEDLMEQVGTRYYRQSLERLLEYTARTSHALVQEFETLISPRKDSSKAA